MKIQMDKLICKCCGEEAVWCGDGTKLSPEKHDCDHIQCDHCGMHYSLEGCEESDNAESFKDMRVVMLRKYNANH